MSPRAANRRNANPDRARIRRQPGATTPGGAARHWPKAFGPRLAKDDGIGAKAVASLFEKCGLYC